MSDTQQGPDWWLASDGKWYPPAAPAQANTPSPSATGGAATERPGWFIPLMVALGLAVVIVGVLGVRAATAPATETVHGYFTVYDTFTGNEGSFCATSGGFSDIDLGTEVKVTDEAGKLLARGHLGVGRVSESALTGLRGCRFQFEVDVKEGSDFYRFEVARRGELSYTWDELGSQGFLVEFSLGS